MLAKDSYAHRFGYLRLNAIDMEKYKREYLDAARYSHDSAPWVKPLAWSSWYMLKVWLFLGAIPALFWLFEFALIVMLIPGVGDRLMPNVYWFEYGLPVEPVKFIFIPVQMILLLNCVVWNGAALVRSVKASSDITLGEAMVDHRARRWLSLQSYSKWRLFQHLWSQCSHRENMIAWVLYWKQGWKLFLLLRPTVFAIACLQAYSMTAKPYVAPHGLISDVLLGYWVIKIVAFVVQALAKMISFCTYVFYLNVKLIEVKNGCALSDYYQNRIVARAAPFISLKNPFLDPPQQHTQKNHVMQMNNISGGNRNWTTRKSEDLGSIDDSFTQNLDRDITELPEHDYDLSDPENFVMPSPRQGQNFLNQSTPPNSLGTSFYGSSYSSDASDYFRQVGPAKAATKFAKSQLARERPISEADTEVSSWYVGHRPNNLDSTADDYTRRSVLDSIYTSDLNTPMSRRNMR